MGSDDQGLGSHASWRRAFYGNFGIAVNETLPQFLHYDQTVEGLKRGQSPFPLLGGLLYLERHIPFEFEAILGPAKRDFPTHFPGRDFNTYYMDHHIGYDQIHYRELLDAVRPFTEDDGKRVDMMKGAQSLYKAKIEFYRGVTKDIFGR